MIRFAVCALLLWAPPASASQWKMVANESRLEFVASYEKQAAPGEFRKFDANVQFDAKKPANGRLKVTVETNSADMGSAELNEGMSTSDWFDMAKYPRAEFVSTRIERTDAGRYAARGTLRIKGVEHDVTVPFVWTEHGDAATMTGELTLDRSHFGIGTGEWSTDDPIGLKVTLKYRVSLKRGH